MSEFVIAFEIRAKRSVKPLSEKILLELCEKTQRLALQELDAYYGGQDWCSKIKAFASMEGPEISYVLTARDQPMEGKIAMTDRVETTFRRHWEILIAQLP